MVFTYILGVIGIIVTLKVIQMTFIGLQMLKTAVCDPSTNDDGLAVESFTDLLERARSNMTVYDDGNDMKGPIYMQQEVIDAVKEKLENNKRFSLRCYFNCNEPTLFRKEFDSYSKVDIKTRPSGDTRPDDTHYKIIDNGRMAYLSRHEHGSKKREFQVVDCTRVNRFALEGVTDELLGEYKVDIKQKFPSA